MAILRLLRRPPYCFLALVTAAIANISLLLILHFDALASIIPLKIPFGAKLSIAWALFAGPFAEFDASAYVGVLLSLLFGVSVAAIVRTIKLYRAPLVSAVAALGSGIASALFAITCLSCGSLALAFLASFFSASSLLIFIPQQSIIFGAISLALIAIALYVLNKNLLRAEMATLPR